MVQTPVDRKKAQDKINAKRDAASAALGYKDIPWRRLGTLIGGGKLDPLKELREDNKRLVHEAFKVNRLTNTLRLIAEAKPEVFDVGGIKMVRAEVINDIQGMAAAAIGGENA